MAPTYNHSERTLLDKDVWGTATDLSRGTMVCLKMYDGATIVGGFGSATLAPNHFTVDGVSYLPYTVRSLEPVGYESLRDLETGDTLRLSFIGNGALGLQQLQTLLDDGTVTAKPAVAAFIAEVAAGGSPSGADQPVEVRVTDDFLYTFLQKRVGDQLMRVEVVRQRPLVDESVLEQPEGEAFARKAFVELRFEPQAFVAAGALCYLAMRHDSPIQVDGATLERAFLSEAWPVSLNHPAGQRAFVMEQHLYEQPRVLRVFKEEVLPYLEILRAKPHEG